MATQFVPLPVEKLGELSNDQIVQHVQAYQKMLNETVTKDGVDFSSTPSSPWSSSSLKLPVLKAAPAAADKPADEKGDKGDESSGDSDESSVIDRSDPDSAAEYIAAAHEYLNKKVETPGLDSSTDEVLAWAKKKLIKLGVDEASDYLKKLSKKYLAELLSEGILDISEGVAAANANSGGVLSSGLLGKIEEIWGDVVKGATDPSALLDLAVKYGLPKFLLNAGVDAIFKDLWKVDDSSPMLEQLAHKYVKEMVKAIVDTLLDNVKTWEDLKNSFDGLIDKLKAKIRKKFEGDSSTASLAAARVTDLHVCPLVNGVVPHVGGPILPPCMPTVLSNKLPNARLVDLATCVGPPDIIAKGAATVLIGSLPATRITDITSHGGSITGPGAIALPVLINDPSVTIIIKPDAAHPQFASQVQTALAKLFATPSGVEWLRQMGKNQQSITIIPTSEQNGYCAPVNGANAGNGVGTPSIIQWNPDLHTVDPSLPGAQGSPGSHVVLAHEMVHALHNGNGDHRNGPNDVFPGMDPKFPSQRNEERSTVGTGGGTIMTPSGPDNNAPDYSKDVPTENSFRDDLGIPRRPGYFPSSWPGGAPW
jgi:uncharacterized Zn-binding protein involved in type VI secretion